ncbi:MAG TPA: adenylate/guanylate cyclase domain-containing protein [Actinomycetota bacterium]|nr:adenylate/guanylate cyclase domain-containing protein [Actinomycetota bacterium]
MKCTSCGAEAPAAAKFCPTCGSPLQSRADERRVVTVLFGDLVGFTALSETMDPEQVKILIDRCFGLLAADITRHGGRVDKVLGDGIVAMFGAPVAHEDDAERAVRTALAMQETISVHASHLQMRIGVNTGEVLVGSLRAGGDYTATGDVVNSASRLQSAASPGQVVVGPQTWAATSQVIRYEPLGALLARGREDPIDAWAAVEAVVPPGRRPRRRRVPLIGREVELGVLCGAVKAAAANRRPHLVVLLGEAGLGKSRLVEEVTAYASSEQGAMWFQSRCPPYGEANPWWPIGETLRQACAIGPGDSEEDTVAKTRETVASALGAGVDDPDVAHTASGLLYLMGDESALADVDPARALQDAQRSLVDVLEALSRHGPLVIVLSELHWADQLVLDMLDYLLERLREAPVVVLATARPELESRWTPKVGRHNLLVVNLDPLDEQASRELVTRLVGEEPPKPLLDLVIERSGGNPLFLEELVALVVDQAGEPGGSSPQDVPATLRGIVSARLDSLGDAERALLEDASVIGQSGSLEALSAMAGLRGEPDAGAVLDSLSLTDLVLVGNDDFRFKSDLVREVAYATLAKSERARRHAFLASWMESLAERTERMDERLEQLAYHWGVAAGLAQELGSIEGVEGDVKDRALDALDRAAARAELRETPLATVMLLDHAMKLNPEAGRGRRLALRRASAKSTLRHLTEAREEALEILSQAEREGDLATKAHALTVLGDVQHREGQEAESAKSLSEAVVLWREVGDRQGEADALRGLGMTNLFCGRLDEAEAVVREALSVSGELEDRRGQAWSLQHLAWISFVRGEAAPAEEWLQSSASLFMQIGDFRGLGWVFGLLGWVRLMQGRLEEAEQYARQVVGESAESGDRWAEGITRSLLGIIGLWQGRTQQAVEGLLRARSVFREIQDAWGEIQAMLAASRALVLDGRPQEAVTLLDEARSMAARHPDTTLRNSSAMASGAVAVQLGHGRRVLEKLDPSGLAAETNVEILVLGGLALLQVGRVDEAVPVLQRARESSGEPGPRARASGPLALALCCSGRPEDALAAASEVDRIDGGTYLDRADAAIAKGLAAAAAGDALTAADAFAGAEQILGATGDRFTPSLLMLARGHASASLGTDDAGLLESARRRLSDLAAGDGWDRVYGSAVMARSAPAAG